MLDRRTNSGHDYGYRASHHGGRGAERIEPGRAARVGAAHLAYDMYAYRIRKYIGAYTAAMNGVDAIVFTGGVGENDVLMRSLCTSSLAYLGIILNEEENGRRTNALREINSSSSRVKILVIPTNEELEIATQCFTLIGDPISS